MAQAVIAVAQWVGMTVFQAATAAGVSVATAATLANVAVVATAAAVTVGAYEVSKAVQPKVGGNYGTQIDFKADPQAGVPYAVGRTAVAGNIVFAQTAGAKNSWLSYVSVYSLGPIDSYESFSVNGTAITFGTDSGEGATGYYQNRMWRLSQLGAVPESGYLHPTATGTKDTPSDHSGFPSEWTSAHKLSGLAADLWILQYNTDRYSAGTPQRQAVLKGVKVYDPRLDSTYPGGSGAHRSTNEATWAWSENPYLHALTWLIGRTQSGKHVMGVGAPIAMIDVAAFVEGANVADANGWTVGGVVYSTDDKYEVLKAFLQAGGGKAMRLGAKISCLVNTPRTTIGTYSKADLAGEASIAGTTSRRDRINTVWPRYREEGQNWQMVALDTPVSVSTYVTEDGATRSRTLEYPLVQDADQVAQLAYYDIADGREFTPVTLPSMPKWMNAEPGDVITVTEPELGMSGQDLLVLRRQRDFSTMVSTLVCRSETAAKHAAALGKTGAAPSTPGLTAFDPNTLAAPGALAFASTGTTVTSTTGSIPVLVITGQNDNTNATKIVVRYRKNGATDWTYWPDVQAPDTGVDVRIEIPAVSGQLYNVEVAYRSARDTLGAWRSLTSVTSGAFSLTIYDNAISDGILTPSEKRDLVPAINANIAARTALRARATAVNLTTGTSAERLAYENAATALDSYLATLTSAVAWNNFTGNTTIAVPATMRTRLQDMQTTETDLQSAVDAIYQGRTQYTDTTGQVLDYRGFYYGYSVDGVSGRATQPLSTSVGSVAVAAHDVILPRISGNYTLSIPAHTFTGLSNDTDYAIFYRPDFGDWFPIVSSGAAAYYTSRDGYFWIGNVRTPTSGGTWTPASNTFNTSGLFIEFACVAASAYVPSGRRIAELAAGDAMVLMSPDGVAALAGEIGRIDFATAPLLRLETALGAILTVSTSAPIMTRKGPGYLPRAVRADTAAPGLPVPILKDGAVVWDVLIAVAPAGEGAVGKISVGGGIYAAADDPAGPFLLAHNNYNKP